MKKIKICNLLHLQQTFRAVNRLQAKIRKLHCALNDIHRCLQRKALLRSTPLRMTAIKASRAAKRTETVGDFVERKEKEALNLHKEIEDFRERFILSGDMTPFVRHYLGAGFWTGGHEHSLLTTWLIRKIGKDRLDLLKKNAEAFQNIV